MSTATKRSVRRAAPTFAGAGKRRGVNYGASWQTKAWTYSRAGCTTPGVTARHHAKRRAQRKARRGSR